MRGSFEGFMRGVYVRVSWDKWGRMRKKEEERERMSKYTEERKRTSKEKEEKGTLFLSLLT